MEEIRRPRRRRRSKTKLRRATARDSHSKQRIRENPESDEPRPERLIRVLERLLRILLWRDVWRERSLDGLLELGVDIRLCEVHFFDHVAFAIGRFLCFRRGQSVGFVGALGAPGDVVPVAEGVDHQDVDVAAHQQEVLAERSKHVPRVEVEEAGDVVQAERRRDRQKDNTSPASGEERLEDFVRVLAGEAEAMREGADDEVDGVDDDVNLDEAEEAEGGDVAPLAALGSVAEGKDELEEHEGQVEVFEYGIDDGRGGVAEGPAAEVICCRGCAADQVHDDFGC